ncbi:4Fe-4S ferredoxin [candidate division WOR-3 bacterium JGI_Cruoil_03_51_56]|uniref:4Fe-4S ferredoxin n=1 Tax=candidate division WOR-3 bacterium JGI_Cruoil_03_51_56 TaxID=1973747 RepID=A0A235BNY7_UNCW3|nr:MAG: 4Fe-4S ferredoxin [candidate division WOR-3 bacterium JGI_Cruoil_03_51_56]
MKYWRKPLDTDRVKPPHGEVHIVIDRCKGCGFCITYCPRQVLEVSTHFNRKGYHPPTVVHPEACVNCGLCETICPDFAIWSTPVEEPEKQQKVTSEK